MLLFLIVQSVCTLENFNKMSRSDVAQQHVQGPLLLLSKEIIPKKAKNKKIRQFKKLVQNNLAKHILVKTFTLYLVYINLTLFNFNPVFKYVQT